MKIPIGNREPPPAVSSVSRAVMHVDIRFEGETLGVGTGFLFRGAERLFLVTNAHNVTGKNPDTKAAIRRDAAVPDNLLVSWLCASRSGNGFKVRWEKSEVPLYDDQDRQLPRWLCHRVDAEILVIAAIPVDPPTDTWMQAVNDPAQGLAKEGAIGPGDDCYIIGFPRGLTGAGRLPIWKRASVATDPGVPWEGKPRFLVDTASREGMSGSPVLVRMEPDFVNLSDDGSLKADSYIGNPWCFAGVYSGRVGVEQEVAQLGVVWHGFLVHEIIESGTPSKSSF